MRKVFLYIYTAYCFIPFLLSFFIVIPAYFIIFNFWPKKKAPHAAHNVSRTWAYYLFFFFFMRVKIKGKELIDQDKVYVFVANHLSMLDIPLYAVACRNTFRFLSKAELTKIPLLGYVIRNLYITVDRSDRADRLKSLDKMKTAIDEGISVFLAPEGTRNKTDEMLLPFKEGAFRLAIATQKPLAILTVKNTREHLHPAKLFQMKPGIIEAEWSVPVETKGMTENDISMLMEMTRKNMQDVLSEMRENR
jgi:1-acyl-sn-glycerol-3-phosphate acyltransferase